MLSYFNAIFRPALVDKLSSTYRASPRGPSAIAEFLFFKKNGTVAGDLIVFNAFV